VVVQADRKDRGANSLEGFDVGGVNFHEAFKGLM
jgi:hypothetical protein